MSTYKPSEETLKYYSDELTKLVASVNRNALIVFVFVIFSWLYIIEGSNIKYITYRAEHRKKIAALQKDIKLQNYAIGDVERSIYNIPKLDDQPANKPVTSGRMILSSPIISNNNQVSSQNINVLLKANLERKRDSLQHEFDNLSAELKNIPSMLNQNEFENSVKDIPFPFKTIFYFENNFKNGPEAIVIIITLLILYVYFNRLKVLRYTSRIIRIVKKESTLNTNEYADLNITNPFWVTPFPAHDSHITVNDYITLTGNRDNKQLFTTLLHVSLLLLFLIELRMFYLEVSYSKRIINILVIANLLLIITTVAFVTDWVCNWRIPDNFNFEKQHVDYSKRRFIIGGSSVAILTTFFLLRKRIPVFLKPNLYSKRKKRTTVSSDANNKWFFNLKTRRYHYFNHKGDNPLLPLNNDLETIQHFFNNSVIIIPKTIDSRFTSKINHPWLVEHLAAEYIKDGKPELAFCLIADKLNEFGGSKAFENNFRLWDFLAKIYYGYKLDNNAFYSTYFSAVCDRSVNGAANRKGNNRLLRRLSKIKSTTWVNKLHARKSIYFNKMNIAGVKVF